MFTKHNPKAYRPLLPGIQMRTLVYGEKTLLAEFHLGAGSQLPHHAHPYEQTGYLVSGHMRLTIEDTVHDIEPGDAWSIPMDVPHSAEILVDTVAIEVFSPVRPDYLPEKP